MVNVSVKVVQIFGKILGKYLNSKNKIVLYLNIFNFSL